MAQELPAKMKNLLTLDVDVFRLGVTAGIDRVRTHRDLVVATLELVKLLMAQLLL
jgi:hypothetical protein